MVLECKLLHTIEIGLHTEFIGEILDVKISEAAVDKDGVPDVEKIRPMIFSPGNGAYYGVGSFLGKAFSIGRR